jgi:hypothetical protein
MNGHESTWRGGAAREHKEHKRGNEEGRVKWEMELRMDEMDRMDGNGEKGKGGEQEQEQGQEQEDWCGCEGNLVKKTRF